MNKRLRDLAAKVPAPRNMTRAVGWSLLVLLLSVRPISAQTVDHFLDLYTQILTCPDSQTYRSYQGLVTIQCPGDDVTLLNSGDMLDVTSAFLDSSGVHGDDYSAGYASASLNTGVVTSQSGSSNSAGGVGQARSQLFDTVNFVNTTGAPVLIDVYVTLQGTVVTGPSDCCPDQQGSQMLDWAFCLGSGCYISSDYTFRYMYLHNSGLGPDGTYITEPGSGWDSVSLDPGDDVTSEVWHGVYSVPDGQSTAQIFSYLATDCRFGASYSHTSSISITLPDGVSFTSGSGVLLTETPSAEQILR